MRVIPWDEVGRRVLDDRPQAATIGVFDGVHRGHQALLAELGREGDPALVVTFRLSPKKVLNPAYAGDLMTWDEKVSALADAGVSTVVAIDFSPAFGTMTGRDFFLSLKRSFVFSKLVLGWNFSFGKDSATTAADLGWLADPHTRLTILRPFQWEGQTVSSSAVRAALAGGDMARVRTLLGRPYSLTLDTSSEEGGLRKVPRSAAAKLLPPPGRYAARLDDRSLIFEIGENDLTWESPPGRRYPKIVFE